MTAARAVGAVEPRRLKEEVVVGGNRGEAALPRGVDRAAETRERLPLVAELHQRQMKAEFQTGPILSPHGRPGEKPAG